jgi:pSer/pThr/pTyr-binding forkhead associated (FHA) protein
MSASIRFISGGRKGSVSVLQPGDRQRLGRDPECELHLDEPNVSRQHACLRFEGTTLLVENLGSTNGIYVNGVRRDRAELRLWDVVVIGGSAFRVEALSGPEAPPGGDSNADRTSYRELLQCLLAMQRILGEDAERMIERSLETLFLALPATRLSLFAIAEDGEPIQGFTTTRSGAATATMSHGFARKVLAAGKAILLSDQATGDRPCRNSTSAPSSASRSRSPGGRSRCCSATTSSSRASSTSTTCRSSSSPARRSSTCSNATSCAGSRPSSR